MRVLVACEESQAVTIELRRLGHEAYSCDIIECSGGHPEWHLQVDALELLKAGKTGAQIKEILEAEKMESSIYITLETLKYLKKGGRITPAAAALGTVLNLKPVLQIQGEKLDAFAKARTVKQAKNIMIDAMKNDFEKRFQDPEGKHMHLELAYTKDLDAALQFKAEVQEAFPGCEIVMNPLSLSVSCHIGPGALAIACSKEI